jgi:hypothetical protein
LSDATSAICEEVIPGVTSPAQPRTALEAEFRFKLNTKY